MFILGILLALGLGSIPGMGLAQLLMACSITSIFGQDAFAQTAIGATASFLLVDTVRLAQAPQLCGSADHILTNNQEPLSNWQILQAKISGSTVGIVTALGLSVLGGKIPMVPTAIITIGVVALSISKSQDWKKSLWYLAFVQGLFLLCNILHISNPTLVIGISLISIPSMLLPNETDENISEAPSSYTVIPCWLLALLTPGVNASALITTVTRQSGITTTSVMCEAATEAAGLGLLLVSGTATGKSILISEIGSSGITFMHGIIAIAAVVISFFCLPWFTQLYKRNYAALGYSTWTLFAVGVNVTTVFINASVWAAIFIGLGLLVQSMGQAKGIPKTSKGLTFSSPVIF